MRPHQEAAPTKGTQEWPMRRRRQTQEIPRGRRRGNSIEEQVSITLETHENIDSVAREGRERVTNVQEEEMGDQRWH